MQEMELFMREIEPEDTAGKRRKRPGVGGALPERQEAETDSEGIRDPERGRQTYPERWGPRGRKRES